MKNEELKKASGYIKTHRLQKRWQKVVTCLAAVVVFCTTYALILPAITMEKEPCQLPEHTHTEACYTQVASVSYREPVCSLESLNLHEHTEECFDEKGEPICGYSDFVVHEHDSACYDEDGNLWCPLPEIEAHTHDAACYAEAEPVHTHTEDCFALERGGLICTKEEGEGHQHTDDCYDWEQVLTCGLTETETAGEPKPQCGKEEIILHKHSADCFDKNDRLICGKQEVLEHVHDQSCFQTVGEPADTEALTCQLAENEEHQHGPLCYGTWELTCELEEHTHTAECNLPVELTEEEQAQVDEVIALIDALPTQEELDETLAAFEDAGDEDGYDAYLAEIVAQAAKTHEAYEALTEAQKLKVTNAARLMALEPLWSAQIPERIVPNNPTDVGPESLPVDYYVCIDDEWVNVGATKTGWYGDYTATGWTDTNRDYITVAQVESVLREYGFHASDGDGLNKKVAYQQKAGDTSIYADVTTPTTVEGQSIVPLSRNAYHPGYNLYYLPGNGKAITNVGLEALDKSANGFYTVTVYGMQGELLEEAVVRKGGSFTYDASDSGVTEWVAAYGGRTEEISGGRISITVTDTTTITPKQTEDAQVDHGVVFKVYIDGTWQEVGSLPYYYSGQVNGQTRAYITSDMAAQILGGYGYSPAADPGYQFGYSYNDIYEIYYKDSAFCMDIVGGSIADGTDIQLYGANHSDAQTFRIREAEEGYHYITPLTNSALHVNAWGGDVTNDTRIALSTATDNASRWRLQWENNGWVSFWTKNAPSSACIDLDGGNIANSTKIHLWNGTENRYWRLQQVYRISNNGGSEQLDNGTYKIGLTEESNGAIVCYYLPNETSNSVNNASEDGLPAGNGFWSITVRDDNHDVYSDGELTALRKVVRADSKETVEIRVLNGDGVTWSCIGKNGLEVPVQRPIQEENGYTIFTFMGVNQPIEIVATELDPSFTVQYYANLDRYVLGNSGDLDIINTSGGNLPQNTAEQSLLWLMLEQTSQNTDQNAGIATPLHSVRTEKKLTKLYENGTYRFSTHPGLQDFDKLWGQSNYKLQAVLVLKDGKDPDSTNNDDWWWYEVNQSTWNNVTFTNLASEENAPRVEGVRQDANGTYRILIQNGTVIRLRYETGSGSYTNQASFHDYDITSGENADHTWRSGIAGINSPGNYVTSRNNQRKFNGSDARDTFAFGNVNCATGLGLAQWGGNNINAYNGIDLGTHYGNDVYKGCTFGLVKGLNNNGNLIWDEWITHPNLFNEGTATGKYSYNDGSLVFHQVGDTYTLTTANSTVGSREGLEYFFNPSPSASKTYTHIFTNDFWPMDSATNKIDPLMGFYNAAYDQCDIQVNGFYDALNAVGRNHDGVNIPSSDDGRAHNWFFGMNFSLSFTLTEDYLGPLEYIFFGDDDMWVFLDGQLVCDIGGVHSAVGEYVNLRDYLPVGSSGQHTLSFFYTERGASGSTCWMSFTLPSVSSAVTGNDVGSLQISKRMGGLTDHAAFSNEEFEFALTLLQRENGQPLSGIYSYKIVDAEHPDDVTHITYGTISDGGTIKLRPGWTATINGLPAGTYYKVEERNTEGYSVTANNTSGYIVTGTIETGSIKPASFVNTPLHELPETGGPGTTMYTIGGLLLLVGAGLLLVYKDKKRRKEDFASS